MVIRAFEKIPYCYRIVVSRPSFRYRIVDILDRGSFKPVTTRYSAHQILSIGLIGSTECHRWEVGVEIGAYRLKNILNRTRYDSRSCFCDGDKALICISEYLI